MKQNISAFLKSNGSLKLFLLAIVFSICSGIIALLSNALGSFLFWIDESSIQIPASEYGYTSSIFILSSLVICVINVVFSLFMNGALFSAYRYFSGKTDKRTGLKTFTELTLADIIILIIEVVILCVLLIGYLPVSKDIASGTSIAAIRSILVISVLIASPLFIGALVLQIINYKGIKKWVGCAYAADENKILGKPSTFVYVYAIITAVICAICLLAVIPRLFNSGYTYSLIFNVGRFLSLGFSLASTVIYIILMKRFKQVLLLLRKRK